MAAVKLTTLEDVNRLVAICNLFADECDIDVKHGRWIVDGKSVLAITSFLGNIVDVEPQTRDEELLKRILSELKNI